MTTYQRFWNVVYFAAVFVFVAGLIFGNHSPGSDIIAGLALIGGMHIYWRVMFEAKDEERIVALVLARMKERRGA